MNRALITDPELVAKARAGRVDEIVRCIGCNACIAHYHAGTELRCAANPRSGRERRFTVTQRTDAPRRLVVVGGGPAGVAAAGEASHAGHEVVLLERSEGLGGQLALAGAAPGGAEMARSFIDNAARQLAQVDVRLGTSADADDVLALEPDAVVVATGARPYRNDRLRLEGVEVLHAWDVLKGEHPGGTNVVVADWGGDPGGLDSAELLATAGKTVTLAVASVAVGELVHQYRRNLYLQRLYRAGVTIAHHLELIGAAEGEVRFRNVFARELETTFAADAVVLALGREPEDSVASHLAEQVPVEEAGDCLSPRSLEEAVLEGTLAARRVFARVGSPA